MTVSSSAWRRSPALPRGFAFSPADLYLLPAGLVWGEQAAAAVVSGNGWPIGDTALAFTAAAILWREGGQVWAALAPFADILAWSEAESEDLARHVGRLIHRVGAKRPAWGTVAMDGPAIMGIVNTTPDSFSDGGDRLAPQVAIDSALAMVEMGASIIDVGGESTRPGALPVSEQQEIDRVAPVVEALAAQGVVVSIDTRHAAVMKVATQAGARIINDVTALEGEGALAVAASSGAALCLMHMQGQPQTMQAEPVYDCAPLDVYDYLAARVAACEAAGIERARIAIDPGIGFGKNDDHNAQIFAALALYHGLGVPVLLGASRKSFIGRLSRGEPPKQRLAGSLAAHLAGLDAGVQVIRVHDVAETAQAVAIWRVMRGAA
ncbi:dihydropteroate synthase [Magnetospirillum moscoviense]|uniref:dihydropteroate synthase n=1 Tax=Magnetospirillum moscoviense TaxID=1437059 RepID=A0A178N0Y1_9PROT|nr:dihydropteroate synthase [Magnetospirillum moscoviense]